MLAGAVQQGPGLGVGASRPNRTWRSRTAQARVDGAGEARVRVVRRAAWRLALEVHRRRAERRAASSAAASRRAALRRLPAPPKCALGSRVSPNEAWGFLSPPTRGERAPGSARAIAHTRDRERPKHVSGYARAMATWLQHMPLESCCAFLAACTG